MKSFYLDFPLSRTHCGIPLGNGNMGVLVWGSDNILCLTLNRADLWDHRQGECVLPGQSYKDLVALYDPYDVGPVNQRFVRQKFPLESDTIGLSWRPTRLPVGRFELQLAPEYSLRRAELDYESGILTVHAGTSRLRLIQSLEKPQLLIEAPDGIIRQTNCRPAWEWVGDLLAKAGYTPPQKLESEVTRGWFQPCPEDPGITVLCSETACGRAIVIETGHEPVVEFEAEDFSSAVKAGKHWWLKYWTTCPKIDIPDDFLKRFYKFALYKFACATHPNGVACGLQGPWHEEYQRAQWSGDYHFNVNIQEIYTPAFASGNFAHLLPLFDMLESEPFQTVMRNNARNLFGIDDGLLLTHAVDDRGMQCGWINTGSVLDFACGGWTAQLYWLYYKYTLDKDFLKKRALPFILGVMRVFEAALEERDGRLSIPLSISAEYGCIFKVKKNGRDVNQNSGRDPSYQLACAHMLADILLECCKILDLPPKPVWLDIKARLPQYTLAGDGDEQHIAIWEGQDLDVCHRHHSHLACIYPFDTLPQPDSEQQKIIDNSIDHWILRGMGQWSEWCYPWAAIIQARLGFKEAPALLLDIWRKIFVNESMATVYLPKFRGLTAHRRADMLKPKETHEIMQLDGTMGAAAAIMEMLVHQRGDTVYLFPGTPSDWSDIEFRNIRLPGAFYISAARKNGRLESVRVKSLKGGNFRISLNDMEPLLIDFNAGEERELIDHNFDGT